MRQASFPTRRRGIQSPCSVLVFVPLHSKPRRPRLSENAYGIPNPNAMCNGAMCIGNIGENGDNS